jgi:hypothetical protein
MKKTFNKFLFFKAVAIITLMAIGLVVTPLTHAIKNKILGVHILSPADLSNAKLLFKQGDMKDDWHFLTIPLALKDLNEPEGWQNFFRETKKYKFIPIVRLATKVEEGVWAQPTRYDIVQLFKFMDQLDWPTEKRYIIIFNEVNHAKEWGGVIDPLSYTQILEFATSWAKTEKANYVVMPAAMDLAAPNSAETMEAFTYLTKMLEYNPWIFDHIDLWNSHSYPNPAFSSSPILTGQNSIRGFEHELNFLKRKTGRDFEVIITETGWVQTSQTEPWLKSYYLYAMQHVWTHPKVVGVTPFLLRGAPGQFSDFSFFDRDNQPTKIFEAFRAGIKGATSD